MTQPKLVRDWKDGYVKATREIRTGGGRMPSGTTYKVTSSGVTAHLESMPCECCGVVFNFTMRGTNKFKGFEWLGYENPQAL